MKIKVLGFSSVHYGKEFAKEALSSIEPYVDKYHIVYSKNPSYGYTTTLQNPDTEFEIRTIAEQVLGDKLIWDAVDNIVSETHHLSLRYKYAEGFDVLIKQDLDEIMFKVPEAIDYCIHNPERYNLIKNFRHYWRGVEYFFTDNQTPSRLENLKALNNSTNNRSPLGVFHMGWSQNLDTIEYKMNVFSHKDEIRPNFIIDKFMAWSPEKYNEITDLHPTTPGLWIQPNYIDKNTGLGTDPPIAKFLLKHPRFNDNSLQITSTMKKKLLYIPMDYHLHEKDDKYFGDFLRAFQLQYDTIIYEGNLDEAIVFRPDIVFFQASISIEDLKILKQVTGALVVMWTGDCRHVPTQNLIDHKEIIDVFMLPFSGKILKVYEQILRKPCHFLWEPIQDWRYMSNQHIQEGPISFVGNIYDHLPGGISRQKSLEFIKPRVKTGYLMTFGGGVGPSINNRLVPQLYNDSFIVICENNWHDIEDYFTPRNLGAMAAGSCALMRYFPGIEKHFQNLHHCLYYRDKYELLEWIEFLYRNPFFRNQIAENGFKLAHDKFSARNWTEEFNKIIITHFLK